MTCRKIRSSRCSVVMHSRSMTSKRSSERSSNGHWNSKKRRGSTGLVLKNCEENGVREPRNVTSGETLPRLPLVEKRDYIQNWILTSDASFSQRPFSSSLGAEAKGEKRFASSPASDCTEKRARVRVETKENSGSRSDGDEKISECRKKLREEPEVSIPPCSKSVASCSKPEVSERSENRVICKFSWHGKKSRRRLEGSSRSVVTSDTGNEANEDFIMDTGSSGSFDKRSRKIEPASPLRWNGYEIGDCSRLLPASQTLSSPIMETDVIIHSSSSSDSLDAVILDDQSSGKSKRSQTGSVRRDHQQLEPRTPCRWKGYGSPEDSKFPEVPLLSSTPSEVASSSEPEIERLEDEGKIEIESVATTVSGVIENVATQNHEAIERIYSSQRVEEKSPVTETFDSDETHYSDGKAAQISVAEVTLMEKQLSANDRTMARNRSELISEASSSSKNEETGIYVSAGRTPRDVAKKRKRAKKGSLVAKLQSLVSLRVSSLQIWQYRFSRNEIKNCRHQCVKLVIRERETRYGRHFLLANVLEDPHKLLDDLFSDDDRKTSREGTVTLIIVPEVNGTPRMGLNSVVDVYPPWEIMNRDARLLCILYFDVVTTQSESTLGNVKEDNVVAVERVLEEFQCPCFERGAIDSSCTVKFTNARPSFISEIFGSSNRPRSHA